MSNIEWTTRTWNPLTGCNKVSPGCRGCYAEKVAAWLQAIGNPRYENGFELTLHWDKLDEPLRWKKSSLIFAPSMSDPFHEQVPDAFIRRFFEVMAEADHHIFQVLTKRGARLAELGPTLPWQSHIWMGVSVESDAPYNAAGDRPTDRIVQLLACGNPNTFLSIEPMIGRVPAAHIARYAAGCGGSGWVIVGGESGPMDRARPIELDHAREVVSACREHGLPVFVKQLGSAWARANGASHPKGGEPMDWPADLRVREYPQAMRDVLGL